MLSPLVTVTCTTQSKQTYSLIDGKINFIPKLTEACLLIELVTFRLVTELKYSTRLITVQHVFMMFHHEI